VYKGSEFVAEGSLHGSASLATDNFNRSVNSNWVTDPSIIHPKVFQGTKTSALGKRTAADDGLSSNKRFKDYSYTESSSSSAPTGNHTMPFRGKARKFPKSKGKSYPARKGNMRSGGFIGRFSGADRPELKFVDAPTGGGNFTTTIPMTVTSSLSRLDLATSAVLGCAFPPNSSPSGRIGARIFLKSLSIKGQVQLNPDTSLLNSVSLNMFIVQDTQTNGAQCTATDIWAVGTGPKQSDYASVNIENSQRFRILKKWCILLTPAGNNGVAFQQPVNVCLDYYRKVGIPLHWTSNDANGALANLTNNSIQFWCAAGGDIGAATVVLDFATRVRYTDKC